MRRIAGGSIAAAVLAIAGIGLWFLSAGGDDRGGDAGPSAASREWTTGDARIIAEAGASFEWEEPRRVRLDSGRIFLDVEPTGEPFEIAHPDGRVKVHGTRLVVEAGDEELRVVVGSGKASLSSDEGSVDLEPGEQGVLRAAQRPAKSQARRFSHLASFAGGAFDGGDEGTPAGGGFLSGLARVPGSAGGSRPLDVVRYHLDVHIEDGMARTTIDQTFFNPSGSRVEGTFLFPLPPDASISRLAMYVSGKLMEGGMAERGRAVEVYEGIVRKMKDPAILEWMEGSTFRLRIFPFEPWTERRIILSYQQPLESLYEHDRYRFPLLEPAAPWGEFSIHVLLKGVDADGAEISAPTYALEKVGEAAGAVEYVYSENNARPAKDLLLEIRRRERSALEYATHEGEGGTTFCITVAPEIAGEVHRGPRRVLLIADRSGNSTGAEREAQRRLEKRLLRALDRQDSIAVLAYSTEAKPWRDSFIPRDRAGLSAATSFLDGEEFYGAGDLAAALRSAEQLFGEPREGDMILYAGDGVDTISGVEPELLAEILPEKIAFFAIPVSRSYDRRLLASIASRSGGRVVPLSPDERIGWRAFDLVSSLRTTQWRDIAWELLDPAGKPVEGEIHADRETLRDGEAMRIAGRIDGPWPARLRLRGETMDLPEPTESAGWVPRLWARLRIDALERDSAFEHRKEIVQLGKEYYVMTPFTSLLVLENDAMYAEYGIDRGRRDHWALYPAPAEWHGRTQPPQILSYWGMGMTGSPSSWSWGEIEQRTQGWTLGVYAFTQPVHLGSSGVIRAGSRGGFAPIGGQPSSFAVDSLSSGLDAPALSAPERLVASVPPTTGAASESAEERSVTTATQSAETRSASSPAASSGSTVRSERRAEARMAPTAVQGWNAVTVRDGTLDPGQLVVIPAGGMGYRRAGGRYPWGEVAYPSIYQPAAGGESAALKEYLRTGGDLAASIGDERVLLFTSGERILVDGGRAAYIGVEGVSAMLDPLLEEVLSRPQYVLDEWRDAPWFLAPYEISTGGALVSERTEDSKQVVTIDRGGWTTTEILFAGAKPLEYRILLRDGTVVRCEVYDAWHTSGGRSLPTHGTVTGAGDVARGEIEIRYGEIAPPERELRKRIERATARRTIPSDVQDLIVAVAYYDRGDVEDLESFLRALETSGALSVDLGKVARLAAMRWAREPCVNALPLAQATPIVQRWLSDPWLSDPRSCSLDAIAAAYREGDIDAFVARVASTGAGEGRPCIEVLEQLAAEAPPALSGLLHYWIGTLAEREG
ncbi:MAG: FecR domain-containing protein, partial [Planctomycetes bacterium]|nr:FecR domain-containing protein [Planctomycetota bacterium]